MFRKIQYFTIFLKGSRKFWGRYKTHLLESVLLKRWL